MAREVLDRRHGLATGVSYVNRADSPRLHVRARVVVLAASACESARLLLNSTSARFPDGLANSSGTRRHATSPIRPGSASSGHIPKMEHGVPHNEDGTGGAHLYMPWWGDNKKLDFPRGYHIELSGGKHSAPGFGFMGGIQRFNGVGGYGKSLKDDYRRFYGATVDFAGRGEMIPNEHTYCEIDPNVVDTYGIPVLRFHAQFSRARDQPGEAHAGDLSRESSTRWAARRCRRCRRARAATASSRSAGSSTRSATTRMGNDPHDVGAERELPGARRQEPVRRRRRAVRVERAQELHLDDPRALDAHGGIHRAAAKGGRTMTINRRDALKLLGALPLIGVPDELGARTGSAAPDAPAPHRFFNAHEWATVHVLADMIIPRDARSGSATDAKVPEFMDRMLAEASEMSRTEMHGGLAWLDTECRARHGNTFVDCTDAQRRNVLDDIAWPKKARPELSHGVAFFNSFRDWVASGFFSTEMGWRDLKYVGNVFNPNWNGCPPEALAALGVTSDVMKARKS